MPQCRHPTFREPLAFFLPILRLSISNERDLLYCFISAYDQIWSGYSDMNAKVSGVNTKYQLVRVEVFHTNRY